MVAQRVVAAAAAFTMFVSITEGLLLEAFVDVGEPKKKKTPWN
jgi:hypothetical protein